MKTTTADPLLNAKPKPTSCNMVWSGANTDDWRFPIHSVSLSTHNGLLNNSRKIEQLCLINDKTHWKQHK
jgi:hypothetical protein